MTKGFVGNATSSLVFQCDGNHSCVPTSFPGSLFFTTLHICLRVQKKTAELNMNTDRNSSYSRFACEYSRHSSLPAARGPQRPRAMRSDCIRRLIPDHLSALSDIKLLRFSMTTFPEIILYKNYKCTKGVIHGHITPLDNNLSNSPTWSRGFTPRCLSKDRFITTFLVWVSANTFLKHKHEDLFSVSVFAVGGFHSCNCHSIPTSS